jgi:stage V sporulation protein B
MLYIIAYFVLYYHIFYLVDNLLEGGNIKRSKVFILNCIILTITAFVIRTINIKFNVYISNIIGFEGMGIYQILMSIYFFMITLSSSGINLAITRIVAEDLSCNNIAGVKRTTKKCIFFSFCLGIIFVIIMFLLSKYIATVFLHDKVSYKILNIMAVSLPFIAMSSAINGYFLAVRRVIKNAATQIFEQILKILLITFFINLVLPYNFKYSCLSLVLGSCIAEILSFSMLYILYLFDKKRYNISKNNKEKFKKGIQNIQINNCNNKNNCNYNKRILNIALPIAFTSCIRSGLSTFNQLIIPSRLAKSGLSFDLALAKYGMITTMTLPILLFPNFLIYSFSSLLIPEISNHFARKNYTQIKNIINYIFKIIFIFSTCSFGIFFTFSNELSLVIYNNLEIGTFLKILSPLVIIMYLDTIIDSILKGLDKQVSVMKCNIADLFISIIVIYFLVPIYGIYGYVAAIFISELFNFSISLYILVKFTKIKINLYMWIIKPTLCILLARFLIPFFSNNILTSINLVKNISIFVFIYLILLIIIKGITKNDFLFLIQNKNK